MRYSGNFYNRVMKCRTASDIYYNSEKISERGGFYSEMRNDNENNVNTWSES